MLQKILGTELKIKIINFFLSQEDTKVFSYLDISHPLNLKGVVWRREINELVDSGFLKLSENQESEAINKEQLTKKIIKAKRGVRQNKEFFTINLDFFLLPEIRALLSKAKVFLSYGIFKEIETVCQPQLLILTGMFINKKDSLVDLIIVGNINRRNFLRLISNLEVTMDREINYSIMTEEEFKYRRYVMDIFLYEVINNDPIIFSGDINEFDILSKASVEKKEVKD